MTKSALREAILQQLRAALALQTNAAALAHDEAISEESRAESKWDTHSQEAAYLAEGQAKLAGEVSASIELYTTLPFPDLGPNGIAVLGALVELAVAGQTAWYFLGPRAGGLELRIDGHQVLVVTPSSPLGRQLIGKRVGDTIKTTGHGTAAMQRVVAVS
ncbi:MAG: transcription elongation factor [Opitutus sp.]|nr:transcription elongation factor [Opitutus sp.]